MSTLWQKICTKASRTGKFLSEALIFASTNPQYDNRLFIELQVQYMKIPSSNLGRTCCVQKLFLTFRKMFSPCSAKRRASDKDLPVKASILRDPGLFLDQHGPTVFEHKDLNGPSTSIDDLLRGIARMYLQTPLRLPEFFPIGQ